MAWGLAAGGRAGLIRTLEILRQEISVTMANVGVSNVRDLSSELVRRSTPPLEQPWPTNLRGTAG
jgi:isopentenyl diphosphate isomerase/L-lactate dehydrogenase-like FMN-dependent dehydrogenase